jgi:hypothetical protein
VSQIPDEAEKIGLVVVRGIGDQGRFEHLDAQVREVASALRAPENTRVTASHL